MDDDDNFEKQLKKDIKSALYFSTNSNEFEDLNYSGSTKHIDVFLCVDTTYFSSSYYVKSKYTELTLELMPVFSKYPDKIDSVTISGNTKKMDIHGNYQYSDTQYVVKKENFNSDSIDWANLKYYPNEDEAIEQNFDTVWWGQSLR